MSCAEESNILPKEVPIIGGQSKRCTKCSVEYPATAAYFYRDKKGKDGLNARCKNCHKEYAKTASEHKKVYMKEWKRRNKDHVSEYNAAWYQEHKEFRSEYNHQWHLDHREYRAEYARLRRETDKSYIQYSIDYYYAHHEDRKQKHRKYIAEHPEVARENQRRRRSLLVELPFDFYDEDEQFSLGYWKRRCAVCGRELGINTNNNIVWAMDHWIPVSDKREDNPGTVLWNMLPLCHGENGCNNSKKNKNPIGWLQKKFPEQADEILHRINEYFKLAKELKDEIQKD